MKRIYERNCVHKTGKMNNNNNTTDATNKTDNQQDPPYIMMIPPIAKQALITCYILIFIIGIVGNAMVIYVLGVKRKLRSFEVQIVSLAAADILSAIFSPLVSMYDLLVNLKEWKLLGSFGCKLFVSMDHVTMLVSAFTLILISADRLRVIASVRTIEQNQGRSLLGVFSTWLMAVIVVSPYMYSLEINNGQCAQSKWSKYGSFIYYAVYTNLSCFIPASIMVIVYAKSVYILLRREIPADNKNIKDKRRLQYKRIVQMFGTIVVLYFLLTTPNMVMSLASSYYGTFSLTSYMDHMELMMSLTYVFFTLSHFNCCVNPFIYAKMHTNIRTSFTRLNTYFLTSMGAIAWHRSAKNHIRTRQESVIMINKTEESLA